MVAKKALNLAEVIVGSSAFYTKKTFLSKEKLSKLQF